MSGTRLTPYTGVEPVYSDSGSQWRRPFGGYWIVERVRLDSGRRHGGHQPCMWVEDTGSRVLVHYRPPGHPGREGGPVRRSQQGVTVVYLSSFLLPS